jgi:hypothetical protein
MFTPYEAHNMHLFLFQYKKIFILQLKWIYLIFIGMFNVMGLDPKSMQALWTMFAYHC